MIIGNRTQIKNKKTLNCKVKTKDTFFDKKFSGIESVENLFKLLTFGGKFVTQTGQFYQFQLCLDTIQNTKDH